MRKIFAQLLMISLLAASFLKGEIAGGESLDSKKDVEIIQAAQILLFQCKSISEVDEMLGRLKDAGVDTIILRVFQNRYDRIYKFSQPKTKVGVYFKTDKAPVVDDVLATVIPLARKHGLKVFAWMTSRQSDWMVERFPAWLDKRYDLKSKKYVTSKKIDLMNADARKYLLGVYSDLASYDIDGILFQDDLVYRYTEGFSSFAREAFERETAIKADPGLFYKKIVNRSGKYFATEYSPQFWDWVRWKNRSILGFAEEIIVAMKKKRPNLKTALNLYYEAVMDPKNGLAWLAQDFQESLKYDFDYFSVMAYHLQIKKALGLSDQQMYSALEELSSRLVGWLDNPARALIKVQMKDWKTGKVEKPANLDKVFSAITGKERTSLAFVPCEKNTPLDIIQRFFKPKKKLAFILENRKLQEAQRKRY